MRTTLVLDAATLPEVMELTRAKTKSEAVRKALEEFIRIKRTEELRSLRGRFDIEDNWRELRELDMASRAELEALDDGDDEEEPS